MKAKRTTVIAYILDESGEVVCDGYNKRLKVSIPKELHDLPPRFCEATKVGTGHTYVGFYRGKKWWIIKYYSQWLKADGIHVEGEYYFAYDIDNEDMRKEFEERIEKYE